MPNDPIYPTEYTPASETVAGDEDDASSAEKIEQDFEKLAKEYGVDKPRRLRIRATIINDQS